MKRSSRKPFLLNRNGFRFNRRPFFLNRNAFQSNRKPFLLNRNAFPFNWKPFLLNRKAFLFSRKPFLLRRKGFRFNRNAFLLDWNAFRFNGKPFLLSRNAFRFNRKAFLLHRKAFRFNGKPLRTSGTIPGMRANLWILALAAVLAAVGSLAYSWTQDRPPVPLLIALALVCFLDVSSLAVVLALRRQQLLRDRPLIPLAILVVSLLVVATLWRPIDILEYFFLYTFLVGSFHLLVFFLLALLLIPVVFRSSSLYFSLIERIGLFSVLLLLSGAISNAAWMRLVYNRFYFSQDTVVDFFPFIPFGQWVLDVKWGDETGALLGGASLWHVQAVWLLFALAAWGSAALVYRRAARVLTA